MLHPSIEITNPSAAVLLERLAESSRRVADGLEETAITVQSQTREEEGFLPVCAAGWAY